MRHAILPTLIVALLCAVGCGDTAVVVPSELHGTWHTDEPRYAHAFLSIDATTVVFGTGEPQPPRYPIVGIESEFGPSGTLYTIGYKTGEAVSRLGVIYEQRDGAALRLRNQPSFSWRRQRSS